MATLVSFNFASPAIGKTLSLPVIYDGREYIMDFNFITTPVKVLDEDLYSTNLYGRHTRFSFYLDSINLAGTPIIYPFSSDPVFIDTFSYAWGESSFTMSWNTDRQCHGGCTTKVEFDLYFQSATQDLFLADAVPDNFSKGYSGTGSILSTDYTWYLSEPPRVTSTTLETFNVLAAPVPEAESLAVVLAGLTTVGAMTLARKRTRQALA